MPCILDTLISYPDPSFYVPSSSPVAEALLKSPCPSDGFLAENPSRGPLPSSAPPECSRGAGVRAQQRGGSSLVAAVPLPGMPRPVREEVRCALVLHALGETQQHAHVVVGGLRAVGRAVGTGGRAEGAQVPARDTPRGPSCP